MIPSLRSIQANLFRVAQYVTCETGEVPGEIFNSVYSVVAVSHRAVVPLRNVGLLRGQKALGLHMDIIALSILDISLSKVFLVREIPIG
jgi:hypothetical protein